MPRGRWKRSSEKFVEPSSAALKLRWRQKYSGSTIYLAPILFNHGAVIYPRRNIIRDSSLSDEIGSNLEKVSGSLKLVLDLALEFVRFRSWFEVCRLLSPSRLSLYNVTNPAVEVLWPKLILESLGALVVKNAPSRM